MYKEKQGWYSLKYFPRKDLLIATGKYYVYSKEKLTDSSLTQRSKQHH
jgi:hypothetical protein